MSWWQAILWHLGRLARKTGARNTIVVEELPEILQPSSLYLVGKKNHWCAALLCPCGCGEVIQLSLLEGSPRWHVKQHWNGTASLHPSVWRIVGCHSHFFLRRGLVIWCGSQQRAGRSVFEP
jgi:hypothetical protein